MNSATHCVARSTVLRRLPDVTPFAACVCEGWGLGSLSRDILVRLKWGKTLAAPGKSGSALQFRSAGPDIVWSATQQAVLQTWVTLRGRKSLPAWNDLVVDDLQDQRDTLMFLDLVDDDGSARLRVNSVGARIISGYGGDVTGRFIDEVIPPAWRDCAMRTYEATIERELPIYSVVDALEREGTLVRMERLLLPFAGDGLDAEHVLASIETSGITGTFNERELGQSPQTESSYALIAVIKI